MEKKLKSYSLDTKLKAVVLKQEGEKCKEIQEKFEIKNRSQIYKWIWLYEKHRASYFDKEPKKKESEKEVNLIKRKIKRKINTSLKK